MVVHENFPNVYFVFLLCCYGDAFFIILKDRANESYKKVEDQRGERVCELEIVRYGGHNEVVGWTQVSLAIRRSFEAVEARAAHVGVGLDVE